MLKMMDPDNLPKFVYLYNNYKYRLKLGFYAAPSNPKIFSKAVKDELNKLKFTYCSDLNGLVMGFGKINSNELIQADIRHCINVVVNVDVYIFRPPIGSIIKAVVNQTSENHVSCLVHNLFNVSIVRPEHQPYNQWPGSKIKKDDKINVKVLSFDLTKKLPHITGDFVDNKYIDDEPDSYSEKYILSKKESVSGFIKSIEHIDKRDTTDSSSKLLSSDSESLYEVDSPITYSKTFENRLTKTSLLNQTNNHIGKHIEHPLFSSTPVSSSEHSVNNINLIRNKQLKQLHKHLTKNAEKEKSLDYVKSKIKLNLPATSIISNDNSGSANKINRQRSLQSDSGISDDDRKQINFTIQNAFSNTSETSTKTIVKHQSSDKIIGSILHSSSQKNEIKYETNVSKHNLLFDFNTDCTSDDDDEKKPVYTQHVNDMINSDEENSVYTQHLHYLKNSDEEKLYNCKSTNEATIREPTTLRLNTRSIKKSNVPQNKYLEDCRNKTFKEHSNKILSMMSDSDSSNEDEKLPIKEINHQSNLNKKIEKNIIDISSGSKVDIINTQYISSSDEIYTKFRQNTSKMDDTKPLKEQTKSQQIFSNYDEKNSSINFHNKISTIIKVLDDTDDCNVNNNNILLKLKEICKKLNNTEQVKSNSTLETLKYSNDEKKSSPNLFIENNNQNEIIGHNIETTSSDDALRLLLRTESAKNVNETSSTLESSIDSNKKNKLTPNLNSKKNKKNEKIGHDIEDSSSDGEMNIFLSKQMSKKPKQVNEKESTLKSSLYSNKKKKVTPNLVSEKNKKNEKIVYNLEEHSSSDDKVNLILRNETLKKNKVKNLNKTSSTLESSMCSNKKKKVTPNLVSEKNKNIVHNLEDFSSDNEVDLILSNETLKKEKRKNVNKISSILESSIGNNKKKKSTPNLSNKTKQKKEIIKHILKDYSISNDKVKCTSLKNNITDKYKINNQKKSNKIPTSVLNLNKNTCTVFKKDISNPFIKLYNQKLTSSSSDDEAFINLTKSKDVINHSSKKKNFSLIKDINKKEDIIKEVLTSIKHKNKKQKQKLPVKHTNLNSKDNDSLVKIKKSETEESIFSTKNKEVFLDKLNNPIDELKPNSSSQNIYLKDSQLKLNPTNDSTDDEIDVIKKILGKKQKLKKINNKKIELPELSMINDIASKSNNLSEVSEKLNKKPKSEKVSTAIRNELINNIIKIKKKRLKETNNLLLDNIMNSLDDFSNGHVQSKKKRKDHNTTIKTDDVSKDTMFYGDLLKIKKKKKKNKHNEDIKLNGLTLQDNKNQYNSSIKFEQQNTPMRKNTFMDITKKKEKKRKVKSTQNTTIDNSKLSDKLGNKYIVKCQERKGSNKNNLKLLTKNQIKTSLLCQNTDALDDLYKNLSSIN